MTGRPRKETQGRVRITQIHSRSGNQERIVRVLTDGLGLGRIGASVELPDNAYTRGMIRRVAHIVRVEPVTVAEPRRRRTANKASTAAGTVEAGGEE
jgi:large subunit ribosomal protein L30